MSHRFYGLHYAHLHQDGPTPGGPDQFVKVLMR